MSSSYEFWLTDDAGRRLALIDKYAFASYTRPTHGYGVIQMGIPYDYFIKKVPDIFRPDWRIDVWRSPEDGFPLRREGSFFLRKFVVYQRTTDGLRILDYYGRSPLDILRRVTITGQVTPYSLTGPIDDMMKEIVTYWVVSTPGPNSCIPYAINTAGTGFDSTGEFSVEKDFGIGPTISRDFSATSVLDALKDIKATSLFMNIDDPVNNHRIFFDVMEGPGLENGFGYIFRTYSDLRGNSRLGGPVFSMANGNISEPAYYEDRLDEYNYILTLGGPGGGDSSLSPDRKLSRWNNIRLSQIGNPSNNQALADQLVYENKADISLNATFLNTPGGGQQPRSLYGVDWDMGDLLPVEFVGKRMNCEVAIVYVSINEDGQEKVISRTDVNAGQQ